MIYEVLLYYMYVLSMYYKCLFLLFVLVMYSFIYKHFLFTLHEKLSKLIH